MGSASDPLAWWGFGLVPSRGPTSDIRSPLSDRVRHFPRNMSNACRDVLYRIRAGVM